MFLRQLVDVSWFGVEKGSCVSLATAFLKAAHRCRHIWYHKLLGHSRSLFGFFLVTASVVFVRTVLWKR